MKLTKQPPTNNLFLILKARWYKIIEAGLKPEEYRELTEYWRKRLTGKKFKTVTFQLGYKNNPLVRMTFELKDIKIGVGITQWGAIRNKKYYVILLGNKIN